ncbi:unnamed protein product [Prunus armeniaca]|uniref:PGG domain-containing protein n=1 Tax=Prunus armeniaca TaxID=36596 RepID=A0A6J5VW87_PRUAR|nr:unnamed protein product [Prunus armeniaca]
MASYEEVDSLFENAMKGQWGKVVETYRNCSKAREANITKSKETALHIAIADGQTETALDLLNIIANGENALNILKIGNEKGNTALHLAARLGYAQVCQSMVTKDRSLVSLRNVNGETPLFLAARNGQTKAFLCLHSHCQEKYHSFRDNHGDTILHAAISGEYFSLAFQIIRLYPELVNSMNENGFSPLHILASKPSAFKSSSRLGLTGHIIYHCLIVEELKEESYKYEACLHNEGAQNNSKYPENYETCMSFARVLRSFIQVLTNTRGNQNWKLCSLLRANGGNKTGKNAADDEENPQQRSSSVIKASPEASSSAMRLQSKGVSDAKSSRSTDAGGTSGLSSSVKKSESKGTNKPHEQGGRNYSYPPNYASLILLFKLMMKAMLIILGIGIWKIKKIQERKERHIWANQVMNELVRHTSSYKYQNTGQNPHQPNKDKEECDVPNPILLDQAPSSTADHEPSKGGNKNVETNLSSSNQNKYQIESDQNQPAHDYKLGLKNGKERKDNKPLGDKKNGNCEADKKQTPILIAAKMGVTEMVETILDKFPVAIQDVDSDNKNVVLLAVENRQPHVYNLLRKRKILKESLLRQLDNQGNSALHLAARCGQYRPWLIPGAALQMQWEIKWYKFVKSSMPHGFFVRYNKKGQTPKEIFITSHQNLIKEGSKWLTKTSESCSVVAALIATVAFATSATVPGGLNQNTGEPILKDESAFGAFTISSLTALCFSVTSLVFFLSILTSRYEERDFSMGLPRKLLLGLTSLFASIASMLVSFCTGHIFVLKHQLRYVAYPLYAATCLPVTFFALAQLPLYFDLMRAIIRKVPQRSYKVSPH